MAAARATSPTQATLLHSSARPIPRRRLTLTRPDDHSCAGWKDAPLHGFLRIRAQDHLARIDLGRAVAEVEGDDVLAAAVGEDARRRLEELEALGRVLRAHGDQAA